MIDNPYLDTIIALVLIYALLSILVSILLEAWNKRTKERGVFLQRVVLRLLNDPLNRNFGYLIYQHPIINKMRKDGNSYPHYISAEAFANALIDTLAEGAVEVSYVDGPDGNYVKQVTGENDPLAVRLMNGVARLNDSEFKRLMTNFLQRNTTPTVAGMIGTHGSPDLDKLKLELGRWFDDYMERVGGEYKNDQRGKLQFLGLVVALTLNVDSIHMAQVLFLDKDLRDQMVSEAERVSDSYVEQKKVAASDSLDVDAFLRSMGARHIDTILTDPVKIRVAQQIADSQYAHYEEQAEQVLDLVRRWQLPIGWNLAEAPLSWVSGERLETIPARFKPAQRAVLKHFQRRNEPRIWNFLKWILGITITTYSLSLGAPFWFDALVKLINIRRSGAKPKPTGERTA